MSSIAHTSAWRQAVIAIVVALLVISLPNGWVRADFSYTVKSGDTLSKIARNNNTTVEALVAANKAKFPCLATNPACLQIGWVITIPGAGGGAAASSGPSTYMVQSGDSLAKIAKKLGVDFNALIAANKATHACLANPTPCPLQIGWTLNVPGGAAAVPTDNPASTIVEYIAAINAGDAARLKATLHPDLAGVNDPAIDEDIRAFLALIKLLQIHYEIKDLQVVERFGDFARVSYTIRATSPFDGGKPLEASGVYVLIRHQGQWKIFAEEFSKLEVTPQ